MKQPEPVFWVLEYITITKDSRTGLLVAIGGTEQAATSGTPCPNTSVPTSRSAW
jgi:hypothetical protein